MRLPSPCPRLWLEGRPAKPEDGACTPVFQCLDAPVPCGPLACPCKEFTMTIHVGDRIPEVTRKRIREGIETLDTHSLFDARKVVLFAVPGAFTPTCSAKHLPGYVEQAAALKAKGVDEIWCVSVNDAFVMGAWGREQKTDGKVRMLADGSALWTKELGLELDLIARGMGVRSQRYSALIVDGVVKQLNVEAAGKFEVSDAATMLSQA
ncbi:hypothetical protein G6F22_015780 [Rhizopus arrhizus]|nr:hypothetical protein G6F22_015780 [Rhizopus arrhizus]